MSAWHPAHAQAYTEEQEALVRDYVCEHPKGPDDAVKFGELLAALNKGWPPSPNRGPQVEAPTLAARESRQAAAAAVVAAGGVWFSLVVIARAIPGIQTCTAMAAPDSLHSTS